MASNVPKFASFRPKPKPVSDLPRETPAPDATGNSSSRRRSTHDRTESRAPEPPKCEKEAPSSKLYFSDRRGDPGISTYGALNRYDVPAYRLFGHGYVLGLGRDQRIDRERSSHNKVYMMPVSGHRQERLLTVKHLPKETGRTLRIVPARDQTVLPEDCDFIALSDRRTMQLGKSGHDTNEDGPLPDQDYRGIERDFSQPLDPDTQYDDDDDDLTSVFAVTKTNAELVRKTHEHPEDIHAWLSFIEHQKTMMAPDLSISEINDTTRRQLADVRIPIYEEALKKSPNVSNNHVRLYKGLLAEARKSWTEAKLTAKWQEVLQIQPGSAELWLMYLDFIQSSYARFKYETCRVTFLESLKALQTSTGVAIEVTLHIFIRLTSMIHSCGYQELALAIWQAVLEINLSQPITSVAGFADFEQFWESEAPRLGEAGANGWRKTIHNDVPVKALSLPPKDSQDSVFEDFRKRENDAVKELRYPGRTSDEVENDDDAFHTIFFTDIEPYLTAIPPDTPKTLLFEAFLCFCGLPPLPRVGKHQRSWWDDPFVLPPRHQSRAISHIPDNEYFSFTQNFKRLCACGTSSFQMSSDLLFHHDFSLRERRLDPEIIRQIITFVVTETHDAALGEYLLAFEHRHFPAQVMQTAKRLLKAEPTSQRLYNAYGLVESVRGRSEKANQVFSMAVSLDAPDTHQSLMLLDSWVWEALMGDGHAEALWRLTSNFAKLPARTEPIQRPHPTALETASMLLSEICEKALLRQDYPSAVVGTSLLALLAYLSSDGEADLAISAHNRLSDWFASHQLSDCPYAELNAQALARFLLSHITRAPIVKPALIRSALEPFISVFPGNTILLSLYAANESRFAIDDRVRAIMRQNAFLHSDTTSVASWSFAIHFETLRGEIAGSTSHSIRALYKHATHCDSPGTYSPALWMSYLLFEVAQMQSEQAKAEGRRRGADGRKRTWERRLSEKEEMVKETFYAGLRNLPWCKEFIMLAFNEEVRSIFSEEELWKIYRVLQEKELRVYVELD